MSRTIVGLDIGASKVRTVIGEADPDGGFRIAGTSEVPSAGLRSGVIVNISEAIEAVRKSVQSVELNSGFSVRSCFVSIGGDQIDSMKSSATVNVNGRDRGGISVVTGDDIKRAYDSAISILPPVADRDIVHAIPQEFVVNDITGVQEPLGMQAYKLKVDLFIVRTSATQKHNIKTCLEEGSIDIENVALGTLAAAQAVATSEELKAGSVLIDIGCDKTDAVVVFHDAPLCVVSVPLGGKHVTRDIASIKGVSDEVAEKIKMEKGWCWEDGIDVEEEVLIPRIGGQAPEQTNNREICRIIQARMEEIFTLVRGEISRKGVVKGSFRGNIILTGGGANLRGIETLAQYVFQTLNVRVGVPSRFSGIEEDYCKPEFATAVGLVISAKNMPSAAPEKRKSSPQKSGEPKGAGFFQKLKEALF